MCVKKKMFWNWFYVKKKKKIPNIGRLCFSCFLLTVKLKVERRRRRGVALTLFFFFSSFLYFSAAIRRSGVSLLPPSVESFPADAHSCPGSRRRWLHTQWDCVCVCVCGRVCGGFFGMKLSLSLSRWEDTHTHSHTHRCAQKLCSDLVDSGSCSGVKGEAGLGFGAAMISHVVCFYFLSVQETQKYQWRSKLARF